MASTRAHALSSHARLHKRGHSASGAASPLSPVADQGVFVFNRSSTPKITYEEPWIESSPHSMPPAPSSHPLKIKPYLRKLSKDSNALDLSRPAAENESLAGLGISEYGGYIPSVSDITFTSINNNRHRHHRSVSSNSQFSNSSGLQRPTPLPLIRQTPLPYTPPTATSSPPSVLEDESRGDDVILDDEFRLRQSTFDSSRRSESLSSVPGVSLRIHTNNSSTRLAASYSQSSVSLTSPVATSRSRGATLQSIETTTSPSSRTSFDHVAHFIRGSRDLHIDPASRAASIRAERQKFQEKELLKERKYEQEAHKQAERKYRKQLKKDEHQRHLSETREKGDFVRSRSTSDAQNEKTPRPSVGGRQYSDHRQAHYNSLPNVVTTVDLEKQSGVAPKVTKSRAAKGRWLRFVTWFKTRLLRMSRK